MTRISCWAMMLSFALAHTARADDAILILDASKSMWSARVQGPTSVRAGTKFQVHWTGPNNARDWITLAQPDGHAGLYEANFCAQHGTGSDQLDAPTKPGKYELRYVLRDEEIIARQPLMVTE